MNAIGLSKRQNADDNKDALLVHEDKFVYHVALPDLQKMAAYRIVETICCGYWASLSLSKESARIDKFHVYENDQEACHHLLASLITPRRVENLLKKCLDEVLDELRNWSSVSNNVFRVIPPLLYYRYNHHRYDLSCLVWLPNGKIDFRNSAAQISRSRETNAVLKFVLMSEYCLQDQIDTFKWKSLPKDYLSSVSFNDERCLEFYWLCYLKNELHKVPKDEYSSPEAAMAAKCTSSYRRWASEYFWNRSSFEDQISIAKSWLKSDRRGDDCYQALILSRMSWQQQRILLSEIPVEIISNFLRDKASNMEQNVMWAWTHSKDNMTREEFDKLVDFLISPYLDLGYHKSLFFALIWDTIPAHFQWQVVEYVDRKIDPLFPATVTIFRLLCKCKSQKNDSFWRLLVLSNVENFANFGEDPRPMHEFVNLALPCSDDLASFKRSLAQSDKMTYSCLRLLGSGKPEYVNLKLKYCLADHRAVQQYTWDLLMQTRTLEKGLYYMDIDKWMEMSDFIDRAFAGDASKAKEKKKQSISSYIAKWPHKKDYAKLADVKRFANFVDIVETLFEHEELKAIKKSFLRSFMELPTHRDVIWRETFFCRRFFQRFILGWCLIGDESATRVLKESLSTDKICAAFFSRLLRIYECKYFDKGILKDLKFYLEWYLGSEEEAKRCIVEKFPKFYDDLDIFKFFSKHRDMFSLNRLIKWAFNGDEKAIKAFKARKTNLASR